MPRTIPEEISAEEEKKLKPIFFWDDTHKPQDFIVSGIPALKRFALAGVLARGKMIASYRGIALCRMPNCKEGLGSQDWAAYGYKFPNGCEHYVLKHGVWLPDCDDLLEAALSELRR